MKSFFNKVALSSKLIEEAVDQLSSLPGIGRKTALRLALHLLKKSNEEVGHFSEAILKMRNNIHYCKKCCNLSDKELCSICENLNRDQSTVCIVEDIRDVMAVEATQQYKGLYHVLGGKISPMDGIGPSDLNISQLEERMKNPEIKEVILALSTTMEGDTTSYYLYKKLFTNDLRFTTIAKGVNIGDELEYTDEITLGRSIVNRTLYENSLRTS